MQRPLVLASLVRAEVGSWYQLALRGVPFAPRLCKAQQRGVDSWLAVMNQTRSQIAVIVDACRALHDVQNRAWQIWAISDFVKFDRICTEQGAIDFT